MRNLFIILLLLLLAQNSWAETFIVSTTPELRDALKKAATNGEDDTINLADGTYKTTDDGKGTFVYLSNESNIIRLQGSDKSLVTLSGENLHQVIRHKLTVGVSSEIVISNISITNGTNIEQLGESGGGILSNSTLVLDNCVLQNNHGVRTHGGAVFADSAVITNSIFRSNSADGGGGAIGVFKNLNVSASSFEGNTSPSYGGAIYAHDLSYNRLISNSTFQNNNARYGGALSITRSVISNSKFYGNAAQSYGGAIHSFGGIEIYNSIFEYNRGISGASIYNGNGSAILNNIFRSNYSDDTYNETSNIYLTELNESDTLLNNIFMLNNTDVEIKSSVLMTLSNNYVDVSRVSTDFVGKNNIYDSLVLGFLDYKNSDYRLINSSGFIDAGTTEITGVNFPKTDLNGNPRISYGTIDIGPYEFIDSDGDGLSNSQDTDDDNDGVLDVADAYPLIAIGELGDVDKDGVPDACDEACLASGMTADTDNDNDGVEDSLDAFPFNDKEQVDTDGDGVGDNYETLNGLNINDKDSDADGLRDDKEVALGTNPLSSDSDLDGIIDGKDKFPLVSLGALEDSDGDGAPDECDDTCLASGMTADRDGIPAYVLLDQPQPEFASLTPTAKIIVTSSYGENFFNVARYVDEVSMVGQTFLISGSSDIDSFMVMPGVKYDLTNLKGSVDKLYMSGPLEEYADSILLDEDTGMMQLSRLTDIGNEVVQFIATNAASDLVIFTDGAISTALIKEAILDGSSLLDLTLDTTLTTSDAKTATGAQVKHIVLDSDGDGVMALGPKITQLISGSSGIDKIYVPAGSVVDASNLKASQDEVYLEGDLDDYTLNYNSSSNFVLSRDVVIDNESFTESVTVANGGNVATNDLIIFADQQLTSEALKLQIN
jgi:predicted outer membrane repeat protein